MQTQYRYLESMYIKDNGKYITICNIQNFKLYKVLEKKIKISETHFIYKQNKSTQHNTTPRTTPIF